MSTYRLVNVSGNPAGRLGAPETEPGPSGVVAANELMSIPFPRPCGLSRRNASDETAPSPHPILRCGRRDYEELDVTIALDLVAVLDTARQEHAPAVSNLKAVVSALESDGSLEDVENFVLRRMCMVRRLLACPSRVLNDRQPPALALLSHLDHEVDVKVVSPALPGPEGIRGNRRVAHE